MTSSREDAGRDCPLWVAPNAGPVGAGKIPSRKSVEASFEFSSVRRERVVVQDRVDVKRNEPPVVIPATVFNELRRHAMEAVPEECCGLITGSGEERYESVWRISNVMTRMHVADVETFPRDARTAYYMAEVEYLQAQKDAEARGEFVTAVYHSHVNADAYLSAEDRVYAESPLFPFPGARQIVLSVVGDRVKDAGIFEIDSESGRFTSEGGRLLEDAE